MSAGETSASKNYKRPTPLIHPSSVVSPEATIHPSCQIGPFCLIEAGVTLGPDCHLHSHVVIHGQSEIGARNEFFPFTAIGIKTQDLKYPGEPTSLKIGDDNVFRENVTVHRSTGPEEPTTIGNKNLFLAYAHIAHDCQLGDHNILSNAAMLAGHIHVGNHVIIAGLSGAHQFIRIGDHAMIGGLAKIVQDVPPFVIADGNPAMVRSLNTIGLQRRGFTPEDLSALKTAYKKLFLKKNLNLSEALTTLQAEPAAKNPHVAHLMEFLKTSKRGVTR